MVPQPFFLCTGDRGPSSSWCGRTNSDSNSQHRLVGGQFVRRVSARPSGTPAAAQLSDSRSDTFGAGSRGPRPARGLTPGRRGIVCPSDRCPTNVPDNRSVLPPKCYCPGRDPRACNARTNRVPKATKGQSRCYVPGRALGPVQDLLGVRRRPSTDRLGDRYLCAPRRGQKIKSESDRIIIRYGIGEGDCMDMDVTGLPPRASSLNVSAQETGDRNGTFAQGQRRMASPKMA